MKIWLVTLATIFCCAALAPRLAFADAHSDAKAHYKKGLSLFALGKYAEAATEYEAAFELEPDPALLYNAAQAHRLGGNKVRALQLYQSFTRLFPKADDGTVQKHIVQLKAAIEAEGKATQAPPMDSRPPAEKRESPTEPAPKAPSPAVTPAETPATNNAVVSTGPPPKKKTPAWVWGVVGGGAAVVLGVALGVGLGIGLSGDVYPSPSVGSARVD